MNGRRAVAEKHLGDANLVRRLLPLAALLLLVGCGGGSTPSSQTSPGGGGSASGQPAAPRPIKVAHAFISAETLPIWVAQDQQLFEKYGLAVEAVPLQT